MLYVRKSAIPNELYAVKCVENATWQGRFAGGSRPDTNERPHKIVMADYFQNLNNKLGAQRTTTNIPSQKVPEVVLCGFYEFSSVLATAIIYLSDFIVLRSSKVRLRGCVV